jgi:hypothetical protein
LVQQGPRRRFGPGAGGKFQIYVDDGREPAIPQRAIGAAHATIGCNARHFVRSRAVPAMGPVRQRVQPAGQSGRAAPKATAAKAESKPKRKSPSTKNASLRRAVNHKFGKGAATGGGKE